MLDLSILTHALSLIGGSFGTVIFNYLRARNQDKIDVKKVDLQQDQQTFLMYKELVNHLSTSVLRMEVEIKQLTKDHHDCTLKNVTLLAQVQNLEGKIKVLEQKII